MSETSNDAGSFTPATDDQLASGQVLILAVQPSSGETPAIGYTATKTQLGGIGPQGPAGPAFTVPVKTIAAAGVTQALAFPSTGSSAFDLTLSANLTLTLSGGVAGQLQELTLVLRQPTTGTPFMISLPNSVNWAGGSAPTVGSTLGSITVITFATSDGGATYFGGL